ncbi:hypothetical protein LAT59_04475 [Candidatus Gracilibacteria bacterium]|nr:hypothetical protein [Candidatus Gracilibacteria bacterium]
MTTLEQKLKHAQQWMLREVLEQKKHLGESLRSEESITEDLQNYFPPEVCMSFSDTDIKELIGSELLYDVQSEHPDIDGSAIILGYQKVFDNLVEKYITKALRKYIKHQGRLPSPQNTPLEKSLFQLIEKGFILSSGRLYELIKNNKNNTQTHYYESIFRDFLEKNAYEKKSLLESDFFLHLDGLQRKKILGEKRHSGIVSRVDTEFARQKYIGEVKEKNSLLYILANLGSVEG